MKYKKLFKTFTGLVLALLVLSCTSLLGTSLYANENSAVATITGTVTSESDNLPIIGANVMVKGTLTGTVTDLDGSFSIEAQPSDVLVISYLGFSTVEVEVGNQTDFSIVISEDAFALSEVIVTGYGSRKLSHNTGAIAQVKGRDIAAIQANRVDDALAGKLSGVLIQNQDGEPGADPRIQIRAASSISGDSNPLIVVDGYPISGSLATVNPNDIESLEILKDAASAAIYGSRGANGVILQTGPEWAAFSRQEIAAGRWDVSQVDPEFLEFRLSAYERSPGVVNVEDWLFQTGSSMNHDLSISGGTDDVRYFASLGYLDTEGIAITQGFERINARLNVDANIGRKVKAGINFNGFSGDRDILGHDIRDLLRAYSVHPIYHTAESIAFVQQLDQEAQALGLDPFDNGYRGGDAPFNNSIYTLQPGDTAQDWHYGRANNGIGGSGVDGLDIKSVLGGDLRDTRDFFWRGLEFDSRARSTQTRLNESNIKRSSVLSETTLNYNKVIGKHDIGAVAGLEFQNFYLSGITLNGTNVPFGQPANFAILDPADISITERDETIARRSVFGRINYAYDNRYLASVSLRRDGDSRFGINNRFEIFPAFSLGWNLHNESFFNSEFLSDLKLLWFIELVESSSNHFWKWFLDSI